MAHLFEPLRLRGVTFANRVVVSPMCEYSSDDGFATDWHLVHLGSRAVGGAGLVFTEATAVTAMGRISPQDLGIWKDGHVEMLRRMVDFIHGQGSRAGIQLAHAGRKGSTWRPGAGEGRIEVADGGWTPIAPSALAFAANYPQPKEMTQTDIDDVVSAFRDAAIRARAADFDVIEIHAAHGYLLHEFLSPLSNQRSDRYGGSLESRARIVCDVASAIRSVWPDPFPLFVRVSATDWTDGGWDVEQSIVLGRMLKGLGVDLIDCSSGGNVATAAIPVGPGYQTPFAARIRREAGMPTGTVGLITSAQQADQIIRNGDADCVLLAREMLRDPYWPMHAAQTLGHPAPWPVQYLRAAPKGTTAR